MYSDDWSLDDCTVWSRYVTHEMEDGDHIHKMDDIIEYYEKPDIETLRQKLIEDMEEVWTKISGKDDKMKYFLLDAWRDSINKRFGVE